MSKFTFKTEKPNGKYRAFGTTFHYIKIKGRWVGNISDAYPHYISLQVIKDDINEDGNANCEWKWITIKRNGARSA